MAKQQFPGIPMGDRARDHTPELQGEGMVAPGQEELAREFEEGPQATDEEKILGKFNSTEDLAKAYAELEKKLGGQDPSPATESASPPSSYTRDQAVETYGEEAVTLSEKAWTWRTLCSKLITARTLVTITTHWLRRSRFLARWWRTMSLSLKLKKWPVKAELTEADAAELKSMVGGEEQFTKLSSGQRAISMQSPADYNAVVDSGNKDAIRWALKSLMSMQSTSPSEPRLLGGRPPSAEAVFNSKQSAQCNEQER